MDLAGAAVDDEAVGLADELECGDPDRQEDVLEGRRRACSTSMRSITCWSPPMSARMSVAITSRITACALREALVDRDLVQLAGEAAQIVGA